MIRGIRFFLNSEDVPLRDWVEMMFILALAFPMRLLANTVSLISEILLTPYTALIEKHIDRISDKSNKLEKIGNILK